MFLKWIAKDKKALRQEEVHKGRLGSKSSERQTGYKDLRDSQRYIKRSLLFFTQVQNLLLSQAVGSVVGYMPQKHEALDSSTSRGVL